MDCQLTVIARDEAMTWELDEWTVWVMLTSLSAEPETLEQVAEAIRRYLPDHSLLEGGSFLKKSDQSVREGASGDDERSDDPWCLIDLISRTAVAGNEFALPQPDGAYQADETDNTDGFPIIWLDTPIDWQFLNADAEIDWRQTVRERTEAVSGESPLDARPVLFGKPMLTHLATGVLAAPPDQLEKEDECRLTQTRAIHAKWLMTSRDDLGGRTPREIVLSDRIRITREVERRSQQWSQQRQAPPPLATDTPAYRFGRFGTVQAVLYFDLIRALMEYAWTLVERQPNLSPEVLTERLADHRDEWLASPREGDSCRLTPAEQIELERRRAPITDDHSAIDCDCPLCLEMASGEFGPTFLWFDGHQLELEDEFAFSLTESRKEWEQDRAIWQGGEEESETDNAEDKATEEMLANEDHGEKIDRSAWQSSYVDWGMLTDSDMPPGVAKMAIGFLLAEFIETLKEQTDEREHLDALNQAYLGFRAAEDPVVAHSAAEELRARLEQTAKAHPELVTKSADLQSRLDEVLRISATSSSQ